MKKILLFIAILFSISSYGQNRFPSIDSAKNYTLRYVKNSAVESFTNLRMQNVTYGTLQLLDSLAGAGVIDTIFKSGDTLKYKIGSTTFIVGTFGGSTDSTIYATKWFVGQNYVPYTGATSDVDLNGNSLNAKSLSITGTGGNGHLHMRFQSSTPSGIGNHTTIYADATGLPYYKIDGASPVQFQKQISLTTTGSSGAATFDGTTLNIPQYSGGGDSSWVSTETGTQPNLVGYLINSTLTSLPSGWADATPDASVTFSGKMIVSGGTTGTASFNSGDGTSTVYSNRIRADFYPYDKMKYAITVIPQDKTASSNGFSIHFESNAEFFSSAMEIKFNFTNTSDSGKIFINYDLGTTIASSANLSHLAGDTLDIEVIRDGWVVRARMFNRRTQKHVDVYYTSSSAFGTGGRMYLGLLGGEQHFTKFQVYSWNRKSYGWTFLGDSQMASAMASSEDKSGAYLVFRGDKTKVANLSNGSVTLKAQASSHVPAAINLNNPVVVFTGHNDQRDLINDTTAFKVRLDSIVKPLQRAGLRVVVSTLTPIFGASSNSIYATAVVNYAAANGLQIIRLDTVFRVSGANVIIKPNLISNDDLHISDSGNIVLANEVIKALGTGISELFNDSISPVRFYNLPMGRENMSNIVVDDEGRVYRQPNRPFNGILNAYNNNGFGTIAQRNSELHVSQTLKTDSALFVHSSSGLKIGFNGGDNINQGNIGSNINITNAGIGGVGFPQAFDIITGLRNVKILSVSGKSSANQTISGNDNLMIQTNSNATLSGTGNTILNTYGSNPLLTSGGGNIFIGGRAGASVTTGSNNIQLISGASGNGANSAATNHTIIIGDIASTNGIPVANDDVIFSTRYSASQNFYFGGKENLFGSFTHTMNAGARNDGTNSAGHTWTFRSSRGTGSGKSGAIIFQTWNSLGSGTTLHTTANTELTIANDSIQVDARARFNAATFINKDSLPITTGKRWGIVVDTATNQLQRQDLNIYRRDLDTIPLATFTVGSAAAGDTAAFSTSTLAGSFYLSGTDTLFITSYTVALQGTSPSITPEVWFNDSLNVTAGGTLLATGSAITNTTTGTSVTATTNKIPQGNFVFVRFSAVTTKPTYFTLTLFGYRIRKA